MAGNEARATCNLQPLLAVQSIAHSFGLRLGNAQPCIQFDSFLGRTGHTFGDAVLVFTCDKNVARRVSLFCVASSYSIRIDFFLRTLHG